MNRRHRSTSRHRNISVSISVVVTFCLLMSAFSPLVMRKAEAASSVGDKFPSGDNARIESFGLLQVQNLQTPSYRNGELLVRFRAGTSQSDKEIVATTHGAHRKKQLSGESAVEKLELTGNDDAATVALQLSLNPAVEFAEPNFLIAKDQLSTTPNDSRFPEQWALGNTGQNGGQFGSDIGVTKAWQMTTGKPATVIAIIDSGVDFTHPDLINNEWTNLTPTNGDVHGWDYVTNRGDIKDEQGHGTAIAGIIAAEGNNATGISGVMWRANLMSLRVLDNTGTGDIGNAVEAIDYAVAHGAQVINLSWGTNGESLALKDAIARAIGRDVVVVCSAGNSGQDLTVAPYYPASFGIGDLIAVAGTDNFDRLASWSNWGDGKVMLAAPGTSILTTKMGGGYWTVDGTSASAPLVTGVAGLIKSARPSLNSHNVVKALKDGARKVASLSGKVSSGGVVSASGALEQLRDSANQSPPLPRPTRGSGGTGPGGSFNTTPPPSTTGAPASNLPNLDQVRNSKPADPKAKAPIQSNLMCADCDPLGGGGGGGYYPAGDPNFSTARRRPVNETGHPGVDLGSRNFNWSAPLLSLNGRAGLDLNLTLFYNSLVWTKDGSYIKYNADLGTPAPGFRLGLPTLQQRFLNSQTGIYAYMMVTPAGDRVELRQVGSSNIYEAQDGSYTQLDVTNPNALIARSSDGTQLTFTPVTINSEYRCTQIKDRNGNYISATYDTTNGHLQTITDTLSRVVTFVYDANSNLIAIRQTWAGVAHDWATFSYGQVYVAPNFGGGLLVNGPNNNYVTVLTQVSLHDGSYFTFNYNSAFGQVNRINHYATDSHLLSYTSYNVDSSAGQTECPRFTEQRDWAENWNNGAEAVTSYSVATDNSWSQQTAPDGTIFKEFFATSGWQNGLTTSTEIWSGGVKKKWTTMAWTQDDTGLSYQKNPRVTESNIYDEAGNRRRAEIAYTSFNLPNPVALPTEVKEYAADGATVLRRTTKTYFYNQAYIDRRVLGLLREVMVYDENNQPVSKVWYDYDWGNEYWEATPQAATQHDASGDQTGRGNLCWIGRWDVSDINNFDKASRAYIKYNRTGSVIRKEDHYGRGSTVSYADSYSDNANRNTFAYPTTVTDADNFVSTAQYNYDFGAVTRTQDPKGAVQNITYDSVARLDRVTNAVNNAYMRYVYGPTYVQSFSSVTTVTDDAYAISVFDGAGRSMGTVTNHPGSAGGYSMVNLIYDQMGRVVKRSNPTEINSAWVPSGDDASGMLYTQQTYDWKGRPLLTTNPDGTTRELTYGGCGCAGGEVTTMRDENGRRRKFTKDVLGRLKQVDELNWDQSVYSTTTYAYNARDQITGTSQAGQPRSFVYDGHGRLQTRTTPEQGPTSYTYFADDAVQTITDARGATTTLAYNNRHLPTSITYGVPAGVAATANVSFGYDAAGNRTSMTDGLGSVSYSYNTLSQLTSETRTFTGVGSFALSYAYNLVGELNSITNPWSTQIGYNYDTVGRPTAVTGSGYGGVSSYVGSMAYRAFGLKQMAYGNSRTLSLQYDNRLRLTQWDLPGVLRMRYGYAWESTGRVEFVRNVDDETLDRYYGYDHVGRLSVSRSGSEARLAVGEQVPLAYDGPYSHGYQYDQFGNITYREGWGGDNPSFTATYTNNRRNGLTYDAGGNLTNDGGQNFSYDTTGQQASASYSGYLLQQYYDGDRLRGEKIDNGAATYYLRSSVLGGQVVAEINSSGALQRGYVYLDGELLAVQQNNQVSWIHQEPVAKSKRVTNSSGTVISTIELDPFGGNTNRNSNDAFQPHRFTTYERDANASDEAMQRRYNRWWSRFDQPDPYDGSYDLTNPQSFNRYAYVQNDPVNFVDPTGLVCAVIWATPTHYIELCDGSGDSGGGGVPWTRDDGRGGGGGGQKKPKPTPKPTPTRQKSQAQNLKDYEDCLKNVKAVFDQAHRAIPNVFHNSLPSAKAVGGILLVTSLRTAGMAVAVGSISLTAAAPLVVSTATAAYAGAWVVNVASNTVSNAAQRGTLLGEEFKARMACRAFLD